MSAKPGLLRRILAGFAGAAVAALLGVAGWQAYRAVLAQPLQRVVFGGELDRLPQAELEALSHAIQASPPGAPLASIREAAKRMPWVREATVRRRFPATVEIHFQVHRAFARWNDAALVSPEGEVFQAEEAAELPRLRGPDASAPEMVREYRVLAAALAPLASPLAELRLTPRGAWQATMGSGLVVELGRGDVAARAQRFAAIWPQVAAQGVPLTHVDLRYPNGFALRSPELLMRRAAEVKPAPTRPKR
ncbi:MAG TPA: cell division protein FtsQ/DivIB [Usitatibacter sp.]|nr:cell division protein FtsQ/DivIB [Usitatibacter sp.]